MRPQTGREAASWLARELAARPPRRIFAPGREHIGDIVNLTGPLLGLRERFPDARIVAEVGASAAPLLAGFPAVDEVWPRPARQGFWGKLRHVLRLRARRFDLAALLDDSNTLVVQAWLGGIPLRVGIWRGAKRRQLYSAYTPLTPDRHDVRDHGEAVLELLGLPPGRCRPRLFPSEAQKEEAARLAASLGVSRRWAALQPGASDPRKRWPADRFASLARKLAERGWQAAFFGSGGEMDLVKEAAEASGSLALEPVDDLLVLGCLLSKFGVVVTNDSGPMHLNAVMGGRGLALYGPTIISHTKPFGDVAILQKPCSCPVRHWTTCRRDCMESLTVDEVLAAAVRRLEEPV